MTLEMIQRKIRENVGERMLMLGRRSRGRLKKRFMDAVDMKVAGVSSKKTVVTPGERSWKVLKIFAPHFSGPFKNIMDLRMYTQ